jgi:hypothetical protein
MENLLVGGIRRTADEFTGIGMGEVLHVSENHISWLAVVLVVLPTSLRGYVS